MTQATRVFTILFFIALLITGCANPGNPDGGPYDETPPQVIGSVPQYGELHAKNNKIQIFFNEFVRVDNASEKVVVSPPQLNLPEITTSGKSIKVQLLDSLKENTTYTVDFSDAIVDNNEGNPLGHYTFVFSTGDAADSMEVSGKVLNAQNLEPIKGILVGLHSDTTDTAFQNVPLKRVARTNGNGEFIIKGVANGKYKAYALQDADGTFTFSQKSEMVAFTPKTFQTDSYPDARADTVWHDSTHIDSIRIIHFTHYTPDNLVLLAFLESHQERHLLKTERTAANCLGIYFTAPSQETPKLEGLNFRTEDAFVLNRTVGNDTLQYWLKDTTLIYKDTLIATCTYLETDTLGELVEKTDTIEFISKISRERQIKLEAESYRKWAKEQEKLKKKDLPYQTKRPEPTLDLTFVSNRTMSPSENIVIETKEPIVDIDTSRIHLLLKKDSTFIPSEYIIKRHPLNIFRFTVFAEWRPEQTYQLMLDSAAITGLYHHPSARQKTQVDIPSLDKYGSIFLNLKGVSDSTAIVELLNSSDKVQRTVRSKNGRAEFYFVKPGTYYLRLYIDRNANNQWDPGDYELGLSPEETYYYPSKLNIRAMWDVEQDWDLRARPLTKQKPLEITKQRPDKEKTIKNRNAQRAKDKR